MQARGVQEVREVHQRSLPHEASSTTRYSRNEDFELPPNN